MRGIAVWFVAVAIASEIGRNHLVASLYEARGHLTPRHMRLRMAVQQQDRRPGSGTGKVDGEVGQLHPLDVKARKEGGRDHLQTFQDGVRNRRATCFRVCRSAKVRRAQGFL